MTANDYVSHFTVVFALALIPCLLAAPVVVRNNTIAETPKLLDMSYGFDNSTLYWPDIDPADRTFRLDTISRGVKNYNNHSIYIEANKFAAAEHGGTHIDAPSHFVPNGTRVGNLPLDQLMGPAVKIDIAKQITESVKNGIDYLMSKADVLAWEKQHGKIANGSLVFVYTGYGKFWPDALKYMGYDGQNDMNLHFPGITEAAAQLFVERGVKAVGIDTVSPDNMRGAFLVHVVLLNAGVIIIENVANLDGLPFVGAQVYGLPMKITHGSGAPVRLVARLSA